MQKLLTILQGIAMEESPYRRNGVTASPQTRHPLRETPDWQAAKNNTGGHGMENARRIIAQLWKPEFSEDVAERIAGLQHVRFVTVPSTSGRNQLPIALAERLKEDLRTGHVIVGEKIAYSDDVQPMKDVPMIERPFMPRCYKLKPESGLTRKTHVVVVEDIMSSGASAKAFVDCLRESGIPVVTTVCLLGKPKLFAEPVLVRELQRSFREHHVDLDARQVADVLAKNQILLLMEHMKRRKNELSSIAERISGVLDARLVEHMGSHSQRETSPGRFSSGKNQGNARSGDGVRDQPHSPDHAGDGGSASSQPEAQPPVGKRKRRRLCSWLMLAISG